MGLCDWPVEVIPFEQSLHFVKNYQFSKNSFTGARSKRRIGKGLFHVKAQFRGLTREQKEAVDAMVTETRGGAKPFLFPAVPTTTPAPMWRNTGYPMMKGRGPGYIRVATFGTELGAKIGKSDFHAGQLLSITSTALAAVSNPKSAPKIRRLLTVLEDSPIRTEAGLKTYDLKISPDVQDLNLGNFNNLLIEAWNPSLILLFDEGALPEFTETPDGYFDMSFEATQISEYELDEFYPLIPFN